ncbi:MAG: DEAD/DEAH box helicase, partial [Planctomycetota bacterium]|nr:DEAD/DEAH box helicase [Planctomycetota bacterium]
MLASQDVVVPVEGNVASENPFAGVPKALQAALRAKGFDSLTAVQSAVIETEVEGKDLQISSQTGSGKTVALGFVITPVLEAQRGGKGPDVLIIVPTRELATQVCKELDWLMADLRDVGVASVVGGTPVFRDRHMLKRGPRVLVGTPGRLLDHVKTGVLDLSNVQELVLDEADQMLDMGFREELEGILDTTPEERRTHLVSATFPRGIQQLAARYQRDAVSIQGTRLGAANQDIEHEGHLVNNRDRYDALVNLLLLAGDERTLVFVERRADAVEVAERLEADGFSAMPLSGELAQSQRDRTMDSFRSGRAMVLVATDVAARGLDVPDVATVIHTAPCINGQVYTHRSGRTGRAGRRGRSVLLAPPNRRFSVTRMLDQAKVNLKWSPVPSANEVMKKVSARAQENLKAEINNALADGPTELHLAHAEELLAVNDNKALVAALLARLEPKQQVRAKDLKAKNKGQEHSSGGGYGKNSYGGSSKNDRGPRQYGGGGGGGGGGSRGGGGVRFFVNYGLNQGATPGRLLAALCRRGEVSGDKVGSIAIHPNASTFDVQSGVAEKFEMCVGRRDERDPQTMIRRDRGPGQPQSNGYSGGGKKSYGDKSYGDKGKSSYGGESKSSYGGGGKSSYGGESK